MKLTASMVYDIALMLRIIYIVWRGWEQGMVSELLRLAGWLAALVLVTVYAEPWSQKVCQALSGGQAPPPLLVSVVQAVLSLLLVSASLAVSRLLARIASARHGGDGILSLTNRLLGAALGIGEALVTAYALVFVLNILTMFINTTWLNGDILAKTIVLRRFL